MFWKCVNLSNQKVSCEFIGQILKLGTEYLNLESAILLEDSDAVIPRKNNLKYLNHYQSLPKLRYLWNKSKVATMILEKYPLISLNKGTANIAYCANEYFEPEKGFWELKCDTVDFSKTQ